MDEAGQRRITCVEALVAKISTLHGVTKAEVAHSATLRDVKSDVTFV